jgi:hypothetical protein
VFIPLGTTFKREGCFGASKAKINAVAAKPGAFYVNVHTASFPGERPQRQAPGRRDARPARCPRLGRPGAGGSSLRSSAVSAGRRAPLLLADG